MVPTIIRETLENILVPRTEFSYFPIYDRLCRPPFLPLGDTIGKYLSHRRYNSPSW